jgi:hypothetical protein
MAGNRPELYLKTSLARTLGSDPRADGLRNVKPVATLVMSSGRRLDLFSAVQIEIQTPKKK